MIVQAQHHSSNLIFLNNRNGKEEEQDFSLQSQAGEFPDQTKMLGNNGVYNQRKRGRETSNQQLPMKSQFPQVIDLSLLHNSNRPSSSSVYTGLRLSSGEDQTQQISNLFQQNSHHRNLVFNSSEDVIAAHIKSEELDEFLHAQAAELRRTLAEKMKRHYKALLGAVEEPLVRKLRQKDAEIERATRRHNELAGRDAQLKAEAQAWQARARAQEATAASLQAQLQLAVNICGRGGRSAQNSRPAEEGLLCAAGNSGLDDAESAYVDPERIRRPRCKGCRQREATVVVLPCRHLSICPECDRTALACPLCLTLRNSSVEAILC